MEPIRLVIADDHTFYREGIRTILHMVAGIEVIGEAATGEEVIAQALEQQPDVILMDIKMPGLNGIEATRQILLRRPQTKVLVVTMFEDDDSVFAAMRAGARGYLVKDADKEELVRAIQAIYRDEAIFSPAGVFGGLDPRLVLEGRRAEMLIAFWLVCMLYSSVLGNSG